MSPRQSSAFHYHLRCILPLLAFLGFRTASAATRPRFTDVTREVGILQEPSAKYGGPVVADLDSDGNYDLILHYHFGKPDIYFQASDGTFTRVAFKKSRDYHGISVAPRTATNSQKLIYFSVGGSGGTPSLPVVFLCNSDRNLTDVSTQLGLGARWGRGRISMFMDLSMQSNKKRARNLGGPDILVADFLGMINGRERFGDQYAYQNNGGRFRVREVPGFKNEVQGRAELTDIDGDGIMEVISFQEFRIYKLVRPFTFVEAAARLAPGINITDYTVNAVVEFDMDNDGDFDLYLARGFEKLASNIPIRKGQKDFPDILLENRNGRYVDVSEGANILGSTNSRGVSAGDFNNDGFVDLIVTQFMTPDVVLLNNGDGTFEHVDPQIPKSKDSSGDNTLAVDYDQDGLVDLITGQGSRKEPVFGPFRLMKNVMPLGKQRRYLIVRVGMDPDLACTALHAVVTVVTAKQRMVRRVGSRGSQKAGGGSYIDTVHFGLGSAKSATKVIVKWTSGRTTTVRGIQSNQKISIGRFSTD